MKKRVIVSIVLACCVISNLYAKDASCGSVPEGTELENALKSKMYDTSEELLKTFKSDIKNYRTNCDDSQDMFEQTQISILTFEDTLSDLKEDLEMSKNRYSIDCSKTPNTQKLESAFNTEKENEIEESYNVYVQERENYLNHCTLHEEYIVVFEESASYDDYYHTWKKDRNEKTL